MTEHEDLLRHQLGNSEAKADGLERLLEKAVRHIQEIAVPLPPEGSRRAALAFVNRIADLLDGKDIDRSSGAAPDEDALKGRRVIVLEDEVYPGMALRVILLDAGADQVRLCNGIAACRAVVAGDFGPDVIVLDLDVGGKDVRPLARELADQGVPFVFHTGFADQDLLSTQFPNHRVLKKPAPADVLVEAVVEAIESAQTG
ncbi:hypothetical protein KCG44_11605 [Pacificimonas sp. WHA3]|uniref:Response regulatory domain-containing protein n=1 Tax=Pacificimonas pallii TaxID=2827236 RepID=A0ABS6SHQ3_9SPHN|nr:hypothetical protein [Pacificimonas pallii]MBV7257431.1 hypothetical protein [Pacificimonas pallii]